MGESVYKTFINRIITDVVASKISTIDQLDKNVASYLTQLQDDGSFPDIDYASDARTDWPPMQHLDRLLAMGLAYTQTESKYYGNDELKAKMDLMLTYWHSKQPSSNNWYQNQIGEPQRMGQYLIVMQNLGKEKISEDLFNKSIARLKNKGGSPSSQTGANRVDVALHWMYRACLTEDDDLMREVRQSDDYGIACCVSYQEIGKQIQFFGARCNLAKALLLAINGGRCENTGTVMVKNIPVLTSDTLKFEEVMDNYKKVLIEIARVYNEAMNIIHYMHDKYYYEKAQMALVDTNPRINLAYGVAGLSIALDSLSAIKYAKVTARRNDIGLTEGFDIEGEFPCFGNDNDKVDHLGVDLVYFFSEELKKLPVYKNARPTLSLLTITSNVMYGKKTGATPDGRAKGVAFAPGANPMHGRDKNGAIASLSSVAKLRYRDSQDGISNTFSIVPKSLGATEEDRVENLVTMMDGYFTKGAHHLNVNVLNREMLYDAMEHPEKYPQLTIRVSGYAVNFVKLSREHQLEVISRSFHERM